MSELLFSNGAAWFTVPALIGTSVFVIRLVLMLMGAAHLGVDLGHGDVPHDIGGLGHAGHAGHSGGGHHHAGSSADQDSTYAFEILSFQSICAFMMGFGWGGVAALRGSNLSPVTSTAIGLACGAGMVWVLALLLRGMHELQSSGNLTLDDTLGAEGEVYANIPASGAGRGQVRLVVGDRDRICNAVAQDDSLPTRTRIRVVRINDDNTVTVAAVPAV